MKFFIKILRMYIVMAVAAVLLSISAFAQNAGSVLPNTGDPFNVVYFIIAAVAVVGFVVVIFLTKPKKNSVNSDNSGNDQEK